MKVCQVTGRLQTRINTVRYLVIWFIFLRRFLLLSEDAESMEWRMVSNCTTIDAEIYGIIPMQK